MTSRAAAVKAGRRSARASNDTVARPCLDGREHGVIVMGSNDRQQPAKHNCRLMVATNRIDRLRAVQHEFGIGQVRKTRPLRALQGGAPGPAVPPDAPDPEIALPAASPPQPAPDRPRRPELTPA